MKILSTILTVLALSAGFSSCSKDDKNDITPPEVMLSDAQKAHLVDLYEEEKLAHDLYSEFYDAHGYTPFSHHTEAEAKHMGFVDEILNLYNISRPNLEPGIFQNVEFQNAYNDWLPQGVSEGVDGCYIAAYIEELDILDLMDGIENIAETQEIIDLYTQLKSGSENHLRAYNKFLKMEFDIDYEPQLMSRELFDSIIASGSGGHGK